MCPMINYDKTVMTLHYFVVAWKEMHFDYLSLQSPHTPFVSRDFCFFKSSIRNMNYTCHSILIHICAVKNHYIPLSPFLQPLRTIQGRIFLWAIWLKKTKRRQIPMHKHFSDERSPCNYLTLICCFLLYYCFYGN